MKKIILSVAFFGAYLFFNQADAQPRVSVHVNIGVQPAWVPSGYSGVNYYYLPDIQAYYDVPQRQFIYMDGGRWMFAASLPDRCRSYDLYGGYKVIVNEPRPYLRDNVYRERYGRYRDYDREPEHHGYGDRNDDYRDGHGNGHGRGHAYGHWKRHEHDD